MVAFDPLGNLPLFLAATHNQNRKERQRTFTLATLVAFLLLVICMLGGITVLNLSRVTLEGLQVAGGLLLLIIFLITWAILMFGERLFQLLGKTGSSVLAQVMALLLSTIAVQFIRSGLEGIWKSLTNCVKRV